MTTEAAPFSAGTVLSQDRNLLDVAGPHEIFSFFADRPEAWQASG